MFNDMGGFIRSGGPFEVVDASATKYPDGNPKTVFGTAKPSTFAVPPLAILHLGMAMQNGADKYGAFNWRDAPVTASTYYNAIGRHLLAWHAGEQIDKYSKCHPLAHVMANCAILLDAEAHACLKDDRPKSAINAVFEFILSNIKKI